jgi:phosphoglycolate phosphatase
MIGARNNGMTAVGVLYGYGTEAELLAAGAHHVCAAPRRLLDYTG